MKPIWLTCGQFTLVDDEDYEYLMRWKWHAQPSRNTFYAIRTSPPINGKRYEVRMHRVLLELEHTDTEIKTDHIDRNGLNNQKANLRLVTVGQNNLNKSAHKNSTSKYKGVGWNVTNKKWAARIKLNGNQTFLGLFKSEIDAAKAYDKAAKVYHGEFANLNFKG